MIGFLDLACDRPTEDNWQRLCEIEQDAAFDYFKGRTGQGFNVYAMVFAVASVAASHLVPISKPEELEFAFETLTKTMREALDATIAENGK